MGLEIMGSIRSSNVKKMAVNLVDNSGETFSLDFAKNREIVKVYISGTSKKTLNSVAGYVTRYMIKKESRRKREEEEIGIS